MRFLRVLSAPLLAAVPLASCGGATGQEPPACSYVYSQSFYRINGHRTPVEVYRPDSGATFPLVFLLHGSTGAFTLKSSQEPEQENLGEKSFARNCFVVVLPHYLEAIGRKSLISPQEIAARFPELLQIAGALLDRAEALPRVKGQPVFVFGQSLGGYLAVALSFRRTEIEAVSEISGGLPEGYGLERSEGPRVLISHGTADIVVPPSEAEALSQYCSERGIIFDKNIYAGEGHYLSENAKLLVIARTVEFFRRTR